MAEPPPACLLAYLLRQHIVPGRPGWAFALALALAQPGVEAELSAERERPSERAL